jgi:hypothetical protein
MNAQVPVPTQSIARHELENVSIKEISNPRSVFKVLTPNNHCALRYIQFDCEERSNNNNNNDNDNNNNCFSNEQHMKKIGEGGSGRVFVGERITDGTKCAIKVQAISTLLHSRSIRVFSNANLQQHHTYIQLITGCNYLIASNHPRLLIGWRIMSSKLKSH